ncbi:MAG: hypothetical protein HY961_07440 [Ignavibacteriae bacterium]|nr:hypothetical protein [Ignavibacteriota bacterium]
MTKRIFLVLLPALLLSCKQTNESIEQTTSRITLTVQNLPPLEAGHYQLWGTFFQFNKSTGVSSPQHEDEYVSFGEFKITTDGTVEALDGGRPEFKLPPNADPQLLRDVVVAIQSEHEVPEPRHDEPGSIVMGGAFRGDAAMATADLSISYADAFNANLDIASGKCTMVSATSPADSNFGLWFVESVAAQTAGLKNLPKLPDEWRYEGWVVDKFRSTVDPPKYYSTGKFMKADSADYDGAGPYADSTRTGHNFPGQDFVRNPVRLDLSPPFRFYFMITLEPYPDNSINPNFLKLLTTETLTIPPQGRTMSMQNVISSVAPRGKVVVNR